MARQTPKGEHKLRTRPATLVELKKEIRKVYGAGAIMQGRSEVVQVDAFPTLVASIDTAIGCGGLPQGRIIEIFGQEGTGKSTTCLQFISACQQHYFDNKGRYGAAALIDAEHAINPVWADRIGVDMDKLILSQPDDGEEAFGIIEHLVDSNLVDLIVVDSVAALIPRAMLEGAISESNIGSQAQLMSRGLNRIKGKAAKTKTTIVFINQVRQKIGMIYGNPEVTPGGLALKFYSSVRAQITKGSALKVDNVVVGFRPTLKFIKNKVAAPFTEAQFDICLGKPERPIFGIDILASLVEVAIARNVIDKNGTHLCFAGIRLGNGVANAVSYLREHPEVAMDVRHKIYGSLLSPASDVAAGTDPGEEYDLSDAVLDGSDGDDDTSTQV